MKKISLDLTGIQPKRLLDQLFTCRTELRTINLLGITTESVGLLFFKELPRMNALREISLTFGRLRDADIKKQAKNYNFAAGSCPSVEVLSITYLTQGKGVSIANPCWTDFFGMFSGLKSLTLQGASGTDEPTFWPKVLSSMPLLKTLALPQSTVNAQVLDAFAAPMSDAQCQICHLAFDYSHLPADWIKKVPSKTPPNFDPVETLLRRLTEANRSLRSIEVSLQVR